MSLIIKNAVIIAKDSALDGKQYDIAIEDGKVKRIAAELTGEHYFNAKGALISAGLFDNWAHFCEPGLEYKEDVISGLDTAIAGGYTDVACLPNTEPIIDNKTQLNFLLRTAHSHSVKLHPYACVSAEGKNEVISEMRDLDHHGSVAFTGGTSPISNSELLLKSLQYTSSFDGLIINRPVDMSLSKHGQMHEGEVSTGLGMKGIPSLAEELAIERDLSLLSYAGGRLHLAGLSTSKGVELIRKAKSEGLAVTCDVAIHNLIYTDEDLISYDSNFKVDPPLRSAEHKESLIDGLLDGTIDCISSFHIPQDEESKNLEFDLAENGMISLQTVIPQLLKLEDRLPLALLLDKVSNGSRRVLGLDPVSFDVGSDARFTLIDTKQEWSFDETTNRSKSKNSVLYGQTLKGRAIGVVLGDQLIELR